MKLEVILVLCLVAPNFGFPILPNRIGPSSFTDRELNQTEKALVWHCYRYHQYGTNVQMVVYEPCQYLTFDMPSDYELQSPNELVYNMRRYWIHLQEETYKQLAYLAGQHVDQAYAMDCMLREKGRNGSLCQILYDDKMDVRNLTQYSAGHRIALQRMQALYQDEAERSRVEDCFIHHRDDRYIGCYLVSWDTDSEKYKTIVAEQFKPQFQDVLKIWENLEKKEQLAKSGNSDLQWYDVQPEFNGDF